MKAATATTRQPATFGEVLRTHRRRAGMTQQQVADLATLSVRAVRDLESGRARRPRRATVQLLGDVLRLSGGSRAAFEAAADPLPQPGRGGEVDWLPPVSPTPLIGRERELRALNDLLTFERHRRVCVVGIPGVGKTRLTLEVATTLRDREGWSVLWRDASDVPDGGSLAESAECVLAGRGGEDTLLVVDGARGTAAAEAAGRLLDRFPRLRVVTTAQVPGQGDGAHLMPVGPLPVPAGTDNTGEDAAGCPSVRLFRTHLRRLRPHQTLGGGTSAAVAALCRWLDGVPGRLVDAASWCLLQSPEELLRAMTEAGDPERFAFPPTDADGLPDPLALALADVGTGERELLARLAALPGGWTVDEAVLLSGTTTRHTAGLLHALLLRGLLRTADEEGTDRFRVLNRLRPLLLAAGGRAAA